LKKYRRVQNWTSLPPLDRPAVAEHPRVLAGIFVSGIVGSAMKMLTEYLERAITLERLAAAEQDSTFKAQLLNQAQAYRKLAAKRAEQYGLPPPSPPEISN
jgi:hypothetical protein